MQVSVGAVLITAGGAPLPHLLLQTSKHILVGLQPLSAEELEASVEELRQSVHGPLAIGHRDHPGDVGWVVSEEDLQWRQPAEADAPLLEDVAPAQEAVIEQVQALGIQRWSTWRTSRVQEEDRIQQLLRDKGLLLGANGTITNLEPGPEAP